MRFSCLCSPAYELVVVGAALHTLGHQSCGSEKHKTQCCPGSCFAHTHSAQCVVHAQILRDHDCACNPPSVSPFLIFGAKESTVALHCRSCSKSPFTYSSKCWLLLHSHHIQDTTCIMPLPFLLSIGLSQQYLRVQGISAINNGLNRLLFYHHISNHNSNTGSGNISWEMQLQSQRPMLCTVHYSLPWTLCCIVSCNIMPPLLRRCLSSRMPTWAHKSVHTRPFLTCIGHT